MNRRDFMKVLLGGATSALLVVQSAGYIEGATKPLLEKIAKLAKVHSWLNTSEDQWNEPAGEWDSQEARRRIFGDDVIDRIEMVRHGVDVDETLDECGTNEYRKRLKKGKIKKALREHRRLPEKVIIGGYKGYEQMRDPNKPEVER